MSEWGRGLSLVWQVGCSDKFQISVIFSTWIWWTLRMVSMAHKRSAADQLRTLQKGNEKKKKKKNLKLEEGKRDRKDSRARVDGRFGMAEKSTLMDKKYKLCLKFDHLVHFVCKCQQKKNIGTNKNCPPIRFKHLERDRPRWRCRPFCKKNWIIDF